MKSDSVRRAQWWTFDRPLYRDPLFLTAMVITVVAFVGSVLKDAAPWSWHLFQVPYVAASAILLVGVTLGSVREYRRGKSEGR
jgi:hypothetical protein